MREGEANRLHVFLSGSTRPLIMYQAFVNTSCLGPDKVVLFKQMHDFVSCNGGGKLILRRSNLPLLQSREWFILNFYVVLFNQPYQDHLLLPSTIYKIVSVKTPAVIEVDYYFQNRIYKNIENFYVVCNNILLGLLMFCMTFV